MFIEVRNHKIQVSHAEAGLDRLGFNVEKRQFIRDTGKIKSRRKEHLVP